TNLVCPAVSVLTNVGLDHTATLGPTLERIAWHKAGIARAGVPLVTGVAEPSAAQVIEEQCRNAEAPLVSLGRDFTYEVRRLDSNGATFDLNVGGTPLEHVAQPPSAVSGEARWGLGALEISMLGA